MDDMTTSRQLVDQILQRFSSLGQLTSRSMFGGYGICYNKTMFALVSDGKFYLRADKTLEQQFMTANMAQFIYRNRGVPVPLSYYLVDETYEWKDTRFLQLLKVALAAALKDKAQKARLKGERLKDLPNLGLSIEKLLSRVGIIDKQMLVQSGALKAYLQIKTICQHANIELLFCLAGAIEGCHVAVLAENVRKELLAHLAHHDAASVV